MARAAIAGRLLVGLLLLCAAGACGSSGKSGGHPAGAPESTARPAPTTSSTSVPGVQTGGARTVLSPIGLNVRAEPSKAAKILGTAAQGAVLTVVGYSGASPGWYQVKGATVTGWISGDPTLSAPGEFRGYTSGQFSALYPATWNASQPSALSSVFRSTTGPDRIVSTAAASASKVPRGRAQYGRSSSQVIVVCGVTSDLVVYQYGGIASTASAPYLAQVVLSLDAHHALAFTAELSGLGTPLQVFRQFLASVTFSSPQCSG